MKDIVYRFVDNVYFVVEIFKINDEEDQEEQFNKAINNNYHFKNECFYLNSIDDAIHMANNLLTRDDDYNYATISLFRDTYNEETESTKCEEAVIIGELWSDYIESSEEE